MSRRRVSHIGNLYRFPLEDRIASPAHRFDEPAEIVVLAEERVERAIEKMMRAE